MPEGTGTFAMWAHNRFLAYVMIGITILVNGGRQIHTSHRSSFLHNWNMFVTL